MDRYGDHRSGSPFSHLKLLQQTGTMDEYIEEFEILMAHIPPMPEDQYMGFLLGGMKEEIQMEVLAFEPPQADRSGAFDRTEVGESGSIEWVA